MKIIGVCIFLVFLAAASLWLPPIGWQSGDQWVSLHPSKNLLAGLLIATGLGLIFVHRWFHGLHARLEGLDAPRWERLVWFIAGMIAILLVSAKLAAHENFQTASWDLGVYSYVCDNIARGRGFWNEVEGTNFLGQHFAPVLAVFAPFFLLWRDPRVLLICQALLAAACFPAMVRLFLTVSSTRMAALAGAASFFCHPSFQGLVAYDFHAEIVAVCLLLWALVLWDQQRRWTSAGLAGIAVLASEVVPLALAGFGGWLVLRRGTRKIGAGLVVFGVAISYAAISWWIPYFRGGLPSPYWDRYGHLGSSIPALARTVLAGGVLPYLFWPVAKLKALMNLFLFVGFLPLLSPGCLLPIMAGLGVHLLSSYPAQHGLGHHYAFAALPFLWHGASRGYGWLRQRFPNWAERFLVSFFLFLASAGLLAMGRYFDPLPPAIRRAFHAARAMIPREATVWASASLVPHLMFDFKTATFPGPGSPGLSWFGAAPPPSPQFIVLDRHHMWPVGHEEADARLQNLAAQKIMSEHGIELWKVGR